MEQRDRNDRPIRVGDTVAITGKVTDLGRTGLLGVFVRVQGCPGRPDGRLLVLDSGEIEVLVTPKEDTVAAPP